MSQESTVSSAFRETPMNPNLRAAGLQQLNDVQPAPAAPQPSGISTPPSVTPAEGSPTPPSAAPTPITPQPATVPPQPAAAPAPQPAFQPDWASIMAQQQRQAQLERENAEMLRRLQEQDTTIGNLMQMQKDYDELQRQQKLQQDASSIDYSQLATVDAEDAKRISEGVLKAMEARLAPVQQQLEQQRQQLAQTAQYQEQRFMQQRAQDTLSKIVSKHPDFMALQNNPNFKAFMQQRDGYSSQTLDDRAAAEFRMGNAEYITHLVDQFKQVQPAAASITSVAPVQTATAPVAPAGQPEQLPTLHELNSMMQMRQITPDQYRDWLAKIRAAQNNQG